MEHAFSGRCSRKFLSVTERLKRYLVGMFQPRPQGFSLQKWVGHPFFEEKALGTRLGMFQTEIRFLFFFFNSFIGYSSCNIQYEFIIQHKKKKEAKTQKG